MKALQTILAILAMSMILPSCGSRVKTPIVLVNPSKLAREDASFRLTRGEISKLADIPVGMLPYLKNEAGEALPSQADDVDGDGNWDELFALIDLEASGQLRVYLDFVSEAEYPEFPERTNIRIGDASSEAYPDLEHATRLEGVSYDNYSGNTESHYQMEGVAWENDRVGFRNYLDQRNGTDIFGKLSREMVLDGVGIKGTPSYHEPAEWGMDILKVGTSLGSGGVAYLYRDSMYRLGDNGSGSCDIIFEGSQRSRFALGFSDWKVGDKVCQVKQVVDIAGGKHYFQSTLTNSCGEMDLVAGIVNMHSEELHVVPAGENHTALYTLDHQAEDGSLLAMVLLIPSDCLIRHGETPDSGEGITSTYYAVMDASMGDALSYRFYSLWEKEDPRWSSREEIESYLEEEGRRWTQSIVRQSR